jgi:hypothetical protein
VYKLVDHHHCRATVVAIGTVVRLVDVCTLEEQIELTDCHAPAAAWLAAAPSRAATITTGTAITAATAITSTVTAAAATTTTAAAAGAVHTAATALVLTTGTATTVVATTRAVDTKQAMASSSAAASYAATASWPAGRLCTADQPNSAMHVANHNIQPTEAESTRRHASSHLPGPIMSTLTPC